MNFLNGMTVLLTYQLMGTILVQWIQLPIPGPVIGMMLLFLTLLYRQRILGKRPDPFLESTSESLLGHLSLLFVPAGVGVMVHFERIFTEWLPISIALVGSTVITIISTALLMQFSDRLIKRIHRHV